MLHRNSNTKGDGVKEVDAEKIAIGVAAAWQRYA